MVYPGTRDEVYASFNFFIYQVPSPVRDTEQVRSAKLLSVCLTSVDNRINFVLHTYYISQPLYLLYQLKKQGLPTSALNIIFKALDVSRIEYILPSFFSGFLSRTDLHRLNAARITDQDITVKDLINRSDRRLFYSTRLSHHCVKLTNYTYSLLTVKTSN